MGLLSKQEVEERQGEEDLGHVSIIEFRAGTGWATFGLN